MSVQSAWRLPLAKDLCNNTHALQKDVIETEYCVTFFLTNSQLSLQVVIVIFFKENLAQRGCVGYEAYYN